MKAIFTTAFLALAAFGCGSGTNSDGTGGGSSTGGGTGTNCQQQYSCINGACTCSTGPKQGNQCCDPENSSCLDNKCNTYCRFCN